MKKIKDAFGSVLFGFIFFIGSFVLLWWNEGNSARNIATAVYANKNAIEIESAKIESSNNDKLVALTGSAVTNSTLRDDNVIMPQTLVLKRTVKMYQWEEEQHEDSDGDKSYEYKKVWSESKINSDNFHNKTHANPDFPLETKSFYAGNAKLGAFELTSQQISKIAPEKELYNLPENKKYSIENGKYYSGKNIQTPDIGDILISYNYAPSGTNISLIGKQQSEHIAPFIYKGRSNYIQYNGTLDKEGIIEKYKHENSILTMILRFIGWLFMFIGLKLIISPIEAIFGFVPILGKIADNIASFIILLLTLILSIITIAIAWFAYRPILSITTIAVSLCIIGIIKQKLPKNYPDKN